MLLPVLPFQSESRVATTGPAQRTVSSVRVLRISVTDRCNLRCVYCMPPQGLRWLPQPQLLSFEQISEVARAAVEHLGITSLKLTGGEPTVRTGLCELVRQLRQIRGVEDLSLTTNGLLLSRLARPLKEAGLDRVTVSIDSLRAGRFRQITRGGSLDEVLAGLDAADGVGLTHPKINCVAMRGLNDDEFAEFARLTLRRDITVRFIEYMPMGEACGGGDGASDLLVPEADIRRAIESELGPLRAVPRLDGGVGPARNFVLAQGRPIGRIGFISAMTQPFCSSCNRLRLTSDGTLYSCLFDGGGRPIRHLFRAGVSRAERATRIAGAMTECVDCKPDQHAAHSAHEMSRIGG